MLAARSRLCAPKPRSNALETVGVPALASPSPATPTGSRLPADVLGKGVPGAAALAKGGLEERSGAEKGGARRLAHHLKELLASAEAQNPGPG